jgi:hypothetical protein
MAAAALAAKRVFQIRERRARFGELIQVDGSHHAWSRAAVLAALCWFS